MRHFGKQVKVVIPFLIALMMIFVIAPLSQAADVGVKASTVSLTVDKAPPDKIDNGGSGIEIFNWIISYDSTPDHYIVQVWDSTDTPITTHNNTTQFPPAEIVVSAGTVATFPNRIEVNVDGLPIGPGTITGSCKWHVPKGFPTGGFFRGHVEYYSKETQGTYEAQATQTFLVDQVTGTLEIVKYNDLNKNGTRDAGEPGLPGWHFNTTGPETLAGDTNGNGLLTFSPVLSGSYQVTETLKPDWVCSDPGPSLQKTVPVPAGGTGHLEFGNYFTKGTLIIFKYNDLNKNGQPDLGEPGLQNWQFTAAGPTPFVAVTDATGKITKTVDAGSYQVTETLLADWVCSDPGASLQKTTTVPVAGTAQLNFGNYSVVTRLTIFKYNDINKNGQLDAGEPGIPNWHFTVTGPTPFEADTDAGGYINHNVSSGDYTIKETLQFDWECTDPGASLTKTINIPAGTTGKVNFGNWSVPHPPTVSQWGMIAMSVLFAGAIVWLVRRKHSAQ